VQPNLLQRTYNLLIREKKDKLISLLSQFKQISVSSLSTKALPILTIKERRHCL